MKWGIWNSLRRGNSGALRRSSNLNVVSTLRMNQRRVLSILHRVVNDLEFACPFRGRKNLPAKIAGEWSKQSKGDPGGSELQQLSQSFHDVARGYPCRSGSKPRISRSMRRQVDVDILNPIEPVTVLRVSHKIIGPPKKFTKWLLLDSLADFTPGSGAAT